eukprot:scaffold3964_cov126-Isochrysis_galbana.AAC.4
MPPSHPDPGGWRQSRTCPRRLSARCCIRHSSPLSPARASRSSRVKARLHRSVAAHQPAPKLARRREPTAPSGASAPVANGPGCPRWLAPSECPAEAARIAAPPLLRQGADGPRRQQRTRPTGRATRDAVAPRWRRMRPPQARRLRAMSAWRRARRGTSATPSVTAASAARQMKWTFAGS